MSLKNLLKKIVPQRPALSFISGIVLTFLALIGSTFYSKQTQTKKLPGRADRLLGDKKGGYTAYPWPREVISVFLGITRHFGIRPKGIIHVGAHHLEEIPVYLKHGI